MSTDCRARVPVVVERLERGCWRVAALTATGPLGGYRVRVSDRPGRYRARLPEVEPGERCPAAVSGSLVHRHRK